jgi:hypothetical protein
MPPMPSRSSELASPPSALPAVRPGPTLVPAASEQTSPPSSRPFPLDEYREYRRLLAESDLNGAVGE